VAGFRGGSGCVICTCKLGLSEEELGSGESFDDVHRALAARALPGGELVRGRCLRGRLRLVKKKTAEWEQMAACAVGQPAKVANAWETSG